MSNPHDTLFKAVFGDPDHARGALQAVVPAALAEALDWSTLARCPGSFVDPELVERHTDLLFSAMWHGGGEALIYVLFEHQSSPDRHMAYRLLRYMVRIWERWLAEHVSAHRLPMIVPVVLYHGAVPWSAPRTFEDVVDVPGGVRSAIEAQLVRFTFLIDDLSAVPDKVLRDRAMTALGRLTEYCFKHARTRSDLIELLVEWLAVMREVVRAAHGLEALAHVIRYILQVNDTVERQQLQAVLEGVGPEAKDVIVTLADRIKQEGLQEGLQLGKRNTLLLFLRSRFGDEAVTRFESHIAVATVEQIDAWIPRAAVCATLHELFAD